MDTDDGFGALPASRTGLSQQAAERFWRKVDRRGVCWLWTAATTSAGYGLFHLNGKDELAHRVSVRLSGYPLPAGAVVDHTCRDRRCVNPAHLRTVDRFTNVHENSEALAHLNSLKEECPAGHSYSGDNLIIRSSGRRRCRECTNAAQRALRARKRRMANV